MKFHEDGSAPSPGQIFVFGSNLAGRHGAGAAKAARRFFGAVNGIGHGLVGQSYALPTKDRQIQTLPLDAVKAYVEEFCDFAESRSDMEFFVTAVGTGLAGYDHSDIAPFFRGLDNCSYPLPWKPYLEKENDRT